MESPEQSAFVGTCPQVEVSGVKIPVPAVPTCETEEPAGTARLFKKDPNCIPASCEKLLWARVVGGSPLQDYYALVEDSAAGPGWQVARAVVRV